MPWRPSGGSSVGALVSANGTTQIAASSGTPATPSNGYAGLVAVPGPNRPMLAMIDDAGAVAPLAMHPAYARPILIAPLDIPSLSISGLGVVNGSIGITGTSNVGAASLTPNTTLAQLASAASAGSACGIFAGTSACSVISGGGAGQGFYASWEFGWTDAVATANMFMGVADATVHGGPTDVQPQTLTALIGVGCTSGDAAFQLYAAGTAAQARQALAMTLVEGNLYRVELYSGLSLSYGYRLTNLHTGASVAGTAAGSAAQVPAAGRPMQLWAYRSNGGTAAAVDLQIATGYAEQFRQ